MNNEEQKKEVEKKKEKKNNFWANLGKVVKDAVDCCME